MRLSDIPQHEIDRIAMSLSNYLAAKVIEKGMDHLIANQREPVNNDFEMKESNDGQIYDTN